MTPDQLAESDRIAADLRAAGVRLGSHYQSRKPNPWIGDDGDWRIQWDAFSLGAWDPDDAEDLGIIAEAFGVPLERLEFDYGECGDDMCQCGIGTTYRVVPA